jgi:hypothetical protein
MHPFARLAVALVGVCPTSVGARPPLPFEFDPVPPPHARLERIASGGPVEIGPPPGEDFGSALVIETLPFAASGTTCGYHDDYDPSCCQLLGAPDAVYAYTPPDDACIDLDLCAVGFDSALHVFDGDPQHAIACDDDGCGPGSRLPRLQLLGGHTYYFVVDGWNTDCGSYTLEVRECAEPCPLPEPSGSLDEGEPLCTDETYDAYNTGCNDFPYSFTYLPCRASGITVRGTYGTWMVGLEEIRDTDWYQVDLAVPAALELRVQGGAPTQIAILDGRLGCGEWGVLCSSVFGAACESIACYAEVPAGTYWLFVAPSQFQGVPCGTPYVLELQGQICPVVGIRPGTWGDVKQRYR